RPDRTRLGVHTERPPMASVGEVSFGGRGMQMRADEQPIRRIVSKIDRSRSETDPHPPGLDGPCPGDRRAAGLPSPAKPGEGSQRTESAMDMGKMPGPRPALRERAAWRLFDRRSRNEIRHAGEGVAWVAAFAFLLPVVACAHVAGDLAKDAA